MKSCVVDALYSVHEQITVIARVYVRVQLSINSKLVADEEIYIIVSEVLVDIYG